MVDEPDSPAQLVRGLNDINKEAAAELSEIEAVAADMLVMTLAIVKAENDFGYAEKHWKVLCRWADYLKNTWRMSRISLTNFRLEMMSVLYWDGQLIRSCCN